MRETPTLDFFDRLEDELRRAAERPPRRVLPPPAAALVAALAVGALALIPIALIGGGQERPEPSKAGPGLSPIGAILPTGSGDPPRRHESMVVASGARSTVGPWQLEVFSYGTPNAKADEARPGHCLMLYLPATPGTGRPGLGGYCGPLKRQLGSLTIPRFGMGESVLPPRRPRMIVVFGRAPRRASKIVVTFPDHHPRVVDPRPAPPNFRSRYGFDASFYVVVLRRTDVREVRVNWLDASGSPGSRGIPVIPPPG